ncbi:MAG: hypothetical protein AABY32_01170 [Nanoarchaeota archaeon]
MKIYNKREMADVVLSSLISIVKKYRNKNHIEIGSYQNGREQGHSIILWNQDNFNSKWIAFSEYRNSDELVVYESRHDPMQGLTDSAWENKKFYNFDKKGKGYKNAIVIFDMIKEFYTVKEVVNN